MPRLLLLVLVLAWFAPSIARADALENFERGEAAYHEQRFSAAALVLESVIAAAANEPVDQAIVLEARKYLAACYLFLERPSDAERQFELLLELDPTYRLDPVVFPRDVVERFETVRARLEDAQDAEREAARREAERRLAEAMAEVRRDRERYGRLYELAEQSPVYRENSRLLAVLPFGFGQFQNQRRRLGRFFAVAEGLTLGLYLTGLIWYQAINDQEVRESDQLRWNRAIDATRALNWAGGTSFAVLVVAGAIEAEVNFVSVRVTSRRRNIPGELTPVGPVTSLGILPGGLRLTVRF